ncbi:hypothetical protein BDZ97DRAFT_1810179 [Flammula alnicola]|nr:hypothetical protein BDZ97DRAFT_1810179 [Flammula alnicola]
MIVSEGPTSKYRFVIADLIFFGLGIRALIIVGQNLMCSREKHEDPAHMYRLQRSELDLVFFQDPGFVP